MKRLLLAVGIGLAGLGAGWMQAQTFIWTGTGLNSNVTAPGNWQGGIVPPSAASSDLTFGNAVRQYVYFPVSQTVGNIVFNGTNTTYWLDGLQSPASVLTLTGNVSSTVGSLYHAQFLLPLFLSNNSHTFSVDGLDLYLQSPISGNGSIVKTGSGLLSLERANTFTGGVTINQGTVQISNGDALGTGTITLNGGTLAKWTDDWFTLANNFSMGANATLAAGFHPGAKLSLTGNISALVPDVKLRLQEGYGILQIDGSILNTPANVAYTFYGGTVILRGTNTYAGGTTIGTTIVESIYGGQVVFGTGASIPATGSIKTNAQGYAGLGDPAALATFVSRLDRTNFQGAIGFDTPGGSLPQIFPTSVDLSVGLPFSNPNFQIGTISEAVLYGQITPPAAATAYNFAGSGRLFLFEAPNAPVPFPLTGVRDLRASTFEGAGFLTDPFLLVVRRPNSTYSGSTIVDRAGLVFDAPGSLPAGSPLSLPTAGSYLGFTETVSDLSVAGFISRIGAGTYDPMSVIGFDSHDHINNLAYPSGANSILTPVTRTVTGIDLTNLASPIYIGTASAAILNGTITTTNDGTDDYYFTGYQGGFLRVDSILGGAGRKLFVGLPTETGNGRISEVQLTGNNTYGGGTTFLSGDLHLDHDNALGTGLLTVAPAFGGGTLRTGVAPAALANNINLIGDLRFDAYRPAGFTLAGVITGSGRLKYVGSNSLTLSGSNTFGGGIENIGGGTITAASNTALGTGHVYLDLASNLVFTTSAPVVGGLSGGWPYENEAVFYSTVTLASSSTLTINQPFDDDFAGNILGSAALIKTGTGKLGLYGNSTYTGGTTISQGRLIAGTPTALGTGPVTLNGGTLGTAGGVVVTNSILFGASGGTLGGSGTIGGSVSVGSNVSLAPGESPGTLTFANALTWAPAGNYNLEVLSATGNVPGTSFDTIVVTNTGSFTLTANSGARFNLNLLSLSADFLPGNVVDFNSSASYSWQIASSFNPIVNFAPNAFNINTSGLGNFTNALNGGFFSVSLGTDGGNPFAGNTAIFLNFTPVPEPATWALMISGLSAIALVYRRRR